MFKGNLDNLKSVVTVSKVFVSKFRGVEYPESGVVVEVDDTVTFVSTGGEVTVSKNRPVLLPYSMFVDLVDALVVDRGNKEIILDFGGAKGEFYYDFEFDTLLLSISSHPMALRQLGLCSLIECIEENVDLRYLSYVSTDSITLCTQLVHDLQSLEAFRAIPNDLYRSILKRYPELRGVEDELLQGYRRAIKAVFLDIVHEVLKFQYTQPTRGLYYNRFKEYFALYGDKAGVFHVDNMEFSIEPYYNRDRMIVSGSDLTFTSTQKTHLYPVCPITLSSIPEVSECKGVFPFYKIEAEVALKIPTFALSTFLLHPSHATGVFQSSGGELLILLRGADGGIVQTYNKFSVFHTKVNAKATCSLLALFSYGYEDQEKAFNERLSNIYDLLNG